MPYLPHIYPIGATFFITFRLADSLPQDIIRLLKEEYEKEIKTIESLDIPEAEKVQNIQNLKKKIFGKYDKQLDNQPYGDCHMNDIKVAQIIWDKVFQYDGIHYSVKALSIMPNHVHMLLDTSVQVPPESDLDEVPFGYVDVGKWMQLIKGGSSFLINKYIGRSGQLWGKESYDHFVRYDKEGEFERIKIYIEMNPLKAGLDDRFYSPPYRFVFEA